MRDTCFYWRTMRGYFTWSGTTVFAHSFMTLQGALHHARCCHIPSKRIWVFFHAVYNIMKEEKINDKVTKQCHYRLWYFLQNWSENSFLSNVEQDENWKLIL